MLNCSVWVLFGYYLPRKFIRIGEGFLCDFEKLVAINVAINDNSKRGKEPNEYFHEYFYIFTLRDYLGANLFIYIHLMASEIEKVGLR